MTAVTERVPSPDTVTPPDAPSTPPGTNVAPFHPAILLAPATIGLAAAAIAVLAGDDLIAAADWVRMSLAVAFALAGVALVRRQATRGVGIVALGAVTMAAVEFLAAALARDATDATPAEAVESVAAGLVLALAFHLLLSLPDGHLVPASHRTVTVGSYVVAVAAGGLRWSQQPTPDLWPLVLLAVLLGVIGLGLSNRTYVASRGAARQRMQWFGLALALVAETALIVGALRLLLEWPPAPLETVAASLILVAVALAAASSPRMVGWVDRLLSHTVSIAGLSALVTVLYLVIVIGLGRVPSDDERSILVLSMAAAGVSALLYLPARERLTEMANRLVYGEARDPSEALDTFGNRMTRALPMDELLLQLVELTKKHLGLCSAEVWTGSGGRLVRAASVPERGEGRLRLDDRELPVVARAGVSGRGWATVWLPALLEGRDGGPMRIVPMTHTGQLFGLLVLERPDGDDEFSEDDDRVLADLARQVALALHNSELDIALQATLEEIQHKNVELQESRVRIVAAGDAERRKFERNLHDGAQQHLVALAVKLRLIQRLAESDSAQALAMVEEARQDVLVTVEEVRALAHGLYPKLLTDFGLGEALSGAASRAALPVEVAVDGLGRYHQDVEAAVYFCCLEAMQNAGKHAGESATIRVEVSHGDDGLHFSVSDDGAGFDMGQRSGGHGFVNMADRLGALGGEVEVWSAPGRGTRISGRIPVSPLPAADASGTGVEAAPSS